MPTEHGRTQLLDAGDDAAVAGTCACLPSFRRREREDQKAASSRMDAVEMLSAADRPEAALPSLNDVISSMILAPSDPDVQWAGLISLRQCRHLATLTLDSVIRLTHGWPPLLSVPGARLQERLSMADLVASRNVGKAANATPQPSVQDDLHAGNTSSAADCGTSSGGGSSCGSGSGCAGSSSSSSNLPPPEPSGKNKGKGKAVTGPMDAVSSDGPMLAAIQPTEDDSATELAKLSDRTIVDVVVAAMLSAREHASIQENGAAILSVLATDQAQLLTHRAQKRAAPNSLNGRTNSTAAVCFVDGVSNTRTAEGTDGLRRHHEVNLSRTRAEVINGGAAGAIVVAMKEHPQLTSVFYCGLVALLALCNGEGDSEAKHQAVAAGVLPLLAKVLQKEQLPPPLWAAGRYTLQAIIRGEPTLRRKAKQCLPRCGFTSLFMLTSSFFL